MKVDIKPFLFRVENYHEFRDFQLYSQLAGINFQFEELPSPVYFYCHAVFWLDGDEENAFAFMMTDEKCIELTNEESCQF